MAHGQIDPARLEGETLRHWYLRSPADIEEERRSAAAQRYDQFFSRPDPPGQDSQSESLGAETSIRDFSGTGWTVGPNGRWRGESLRTDDARPGRSARDPVAANGHARGTSSREPPRSCITCHGRVPPPPLPPPFGTFPFPSFYFPRSGGGSGGSDDSNRSRGEWSGRPQCNQQFDADREVCREAKSSQCWENQNKRLSHCSLTGEVGIPRLKFGGR